MSLTKVVILLPSNGQVHTHFMLSLLDLTQSLQSRGIPFSTKNFEFSDLIHSRNYLISYFLSQKEFTHALMLDTDLVFRPSQFFRLFDFDADFTAAVYPDRRVTHQVMKAALEDATPDDLTSNVSVQRLLARHMSYVATTDIGKGQTLKYKRRNGFHTVASVGAGFLLLKRAVAERMVDEGHAHKLPRQGQLRKYSDAPDFADFFSHQLTPDMDAYYGEDQSFCRRWILGCGGDVWADANSSVHHIGSFTYFGDYGSWLKANDPLK